MCAQFAFTAAFRHGGLGVPQGNTVGWGVRGSLWRPNGLAQQQSAGQRLVSFLPEGWLLSASMAIIRVALAARWEL